MQQQKCQKSYSLTQTCQHCFPGLTKTQKSYAKQQENNKNATKSYFVKQQQ